MTRQVCLFHCCFFLSALLAGDAVVLGYVEWWVLASVQCGADPWHALDDGNVKLARAEVVTWGYAQLAC
jgi:hypothetical protein